MKNKIILLIAIVVVAVGLGALYGKNQNDHDEMPSAIGGNFSLSGRDGKISLHDFKGKVSIIYFGFITCPDVCPLSLSKLGTKLKELSSEEVEKIQTIFISVDWKRDTPQKVQEYADFFGDNIIGLTGSEEEINKVTRQYSAYYNFVPLENSKIGYTVDHSSRFYIINGKGHYVGSFSDVTNDENFLLTVKKTVGSL